MQCYTELTPPTAVTHALSLPFLSPSSSALVLAKTSLLQIFTTKSISKEVDTASSGHAAARDNVHYADRRMQDGDGLDPSFLAADMVLQRAERSNDTKLVLLAEHPLSGVVTSLARVKILNSKSGGEALLLAFKDAKLSLVEWDPERHGLSTISIHYYEREDLQGSPWAPDLAQCVNFLTVDPSSRCAALKFGVRNLAILPFRQPGDDLVMDDYDPDIDGERPETNQDSAKQTQEENEGRGTPYNASFVLPLSALDPSLIHPIHLSFLYEYREPTFGIISSSSAATSSLLYERRDLVSYTVFTLDLEQRASTTILSVTGLPYDLFKVIPLPVPIGGALLVGGNELIHIDQAGKTNGVAVNAFARECSSFGMADQSDLRMKLEGCVIEQLAMDVGDMLLVLSTGELAILTFKLDGRSVSGFSVRRVPVESGGSVIKSTASCTASLSRGRMFVGSEESDSVVLGWSRKPVQPARRKSLAEGMEDETFFDVEEIDDYDDDLYSAGGEDARRNSDVFASTSTPSYSKSGDWSFRVHDSLLNIAPLTDLAIGKSGLDPNAEQESPTQDVTADLELVVATGTGKAGGVAMLKREIAPKTIGRFTFPEASGIWSVRAKQPVAKGLIPQASGQGKVSLDGGYAADDEYDRFMIVSRASSSGGEESNVYALTSTGFEEMGGTEFDPAAGGTVDVGLLGGDTRVIQILRSEIRSYDGDLGLAQIYPLTDDISDAEPKVICTSFADPYLIVIREDFTAAVVQCDASGDLDELEKGDAFSETKWVSGSLYHDRQRLFRPPLTEMKSEGSNGESAEDQGTLVLLFMLSHDGSLQIFRLPDLSRPVFVAAGLSLLLPLLSADYSGRRSTARERVLEILVADLGDSVAKSPYLILRAANDDLIIYEPFQSPVPSDKTPDWSGLCFSKICTSTSCESSTATTQSHDGDDDMVPEQRLRLANDIGGYAVVFQPGSFPRFLLKGRSTVPRVLPLRGKPVRCMSGFHTGGCERGFVYGDTEGVVRVAQLPPDYSFAELGWAVKKIGLDAQVDAMSYHPSTESYVLGASTTTEYELPKDDDYHRDWAKEDVSLKPLIDQGSLKVISPTNWSVIDTYELPTNEVVLCITTANLEVSEVTHVRKPLIAVGTCSTHAVDLPACGSIYIFDIIPVVPVPGRPETNRKLKLLAKEDCKGAITALSEVGTQGFLLAAQGQKCMVRGLKEDGSFLPVAFMDMSCYVSVAKCLPRSGMCLMGDAIKGLWFVGYSEEPYKMTLFGKSSTRFEVLAADFLPDGDALYIVVADAECNLHVLQFDPEHPKSLSGTHLLHHRTFHTGHFPSSMVRLPSSANSSVLLHTTTSGAIALLTPLPEPSYRRLAAVSSALTTAVDWACGLNPRAYRAGGGGAAAGVGMGVGAAGGGGAGGVLDGAVLRRWDELGVARRREIEARVGSEGGEIRGDLRGVGLGGGLGKSVLGYL